MTINLEYNRLFSPFTHTRTYFLLHTCNTYSQFLMPGLVDCHIHAEQITNAGANYEKPFQDWVFQDFFPTGQQFGMNPAYARNTSSLLVVCNIFVKGNSYLSFPTQLPQFAFLFLILLLYTSFIHSYCGRKTFVLIHSLL